MADYELVDFGDGRKLERFGSFLLDRPCPAAEGFGKSMSHRWQAANVVLDERGAVIRGELPTRAWQIQLHDITLELKLTPFGHVGVFPEQATNWVWLCDYVQARRQVQLPTYALNLFAYTGSTSLVLAKSGANVVHVDASAPAVNWARKNASLSGLNEAPIRWIVEDARKYVSRELRRGNQYDLVVLDPPSFGHGPQGQRWAIEEDLLPLLRDCENLMRGRRDACLLLTAHSSVPGQSQLTDMVIETCRSPITTDRLSLSDHADRKLDAGFFVRCRIASK